MTDIKNKKTARGRMSDGRPNPVDVHVGRRIRLRRTLLGYSQEKLAALLGLTFQQVQKYERGSNRLGASRLWDMACVLNVPVTFFYTDMPLSVQQASPRYQVADNTIKFAGKLLIAAEAVGCDDPMTSSQTLELVNNFYKIGNRSLAEQLLNIIETLALHKNREVMK